MLKFQIEYWITDNFLFGLFLKESGSRQTERKWKDYDAGSLSLPLIKL